jgi:hypothetical protein
LDESGYSEIRVRWLERFPSTRPTLRFFRGAGGLARSTRWRAAFSWLGIVGGAAVFVATLAVSLDDPVLVVGWAGALRSGMVIVAGGS